MTRTDFTTPRYIYASFFRVAAGLLLFIDLLLMLPMANGIYAIPEFNYDYNAPLLDFLRKNIYIFLSFYGVILLSFIAGIGKYLTSLLVFIFYTINFLLISPAITWGDFIFQHSLLFFIVVNSFCFRCINPSEQKQNTLQYLGVLSLIIHLIYIYVSNGYHKMQNPDWLNGVAVAYFLQHHSPLDFLNIGHYLSTQKWFCLLADYGTLTFQVLFPIAVFFRKTRNIWFAIAIILHVTFGLLIHLEKFQFLLLLHLGFFYTDAELLKTRFFRTFALQKNIK